MNLVQPLAVAMLLFGPPRPAPHWTPQQSGANARLRGVSAVNERVAWASGAQGTLLRTTNGGDTWQRLTIPGTGQLDFRDIDALDEQTAYALSIGPGDASRIYRTVDAGLTWQLQFTNRDPQAFYDAMAFSSPRRGFAFSDSVNGRFVLAETRDGVTWSLVSPEKLPPALPGEGAFAASGTNIALHGGKRIWVGTGAGRVLRSMDGGRTWGVSVTGLKTSPTAGIFSIAFQDSRRGIAVGGDYKEENATDHAAITNDAGQTWQLVNGLSGFRSVVAWLSVTSVVAIGPAGADLSHDGGRTWQPLPGGGYHAFNCVKGGRTGWGVGEGGKIGRLRW